MTDIPRTYPESDLCEGCPPVCYPTEKWRCLPCPRRSPSPAVETGGPVLSSPETASNPLPDNGSPPVLSAPQDLAGRLEAIVPNFFGSDGSEKSNPIDMRLIKEAAARIRTLEGEKADLRAELLASRASTAAAVEHGGKGWRKAATAESLLERAREALGKIALLSDQKNEPTDVSDRLHYWRDKTIDAAILARGGLAGIARLAMEGGGG